MKIKKFEDIKKILRLTNKEKEIISEKDFKELFYLKEEEPKRAEKTWYKMFKDYRKR